MGYSEYYKKEEEKMNLAKKYKQLFEGKARSNDSKILKEYRSFELDWEDVIDIAQMNQTSEDYYVTAEDGSEVQIPLEQGEFLSGSPLRRDTKGPATGNTKFLTATIDKSAGDFYKFEFDKASVDVLKKAGVDAEDVAAELESWSEEELEYL